jgi:integrase
MRDALTENQLRDSSAIVSQSIRSDEGVERLGFNEAREKTKAKVVSLKVSRTRKSKGHVFRSIDFPSLADKLTGKVTVFRRSNGVWYVRFTLNGKRRMLSTKERDKEKALLKIREIVNQSAEDKHLSESRQKTTFAKLTLEYRPFAEKTKSVSTLRGEASVTKHLLKAFGNKNLQEITGRDIENYMLTLSKSVKPATVNRHIALMRHMLRKATEWGYIKDNPARMVKQFKEPPGRTRWLTDSERERLLYECRLSKSELLYQIVFTALNTGMRKGELENLTWEDVDFKERVITIRTSKNNETRHIPINKALLAVLHNLYNRMPHAHYVFSKPDGKVYGNWKRAFDTACKKARVKDFRFHDLRHTFGSYLGMKGYNAFTIMKLMGHKTLAMSARYTHISDRHLRAAVDEIGAEMVQSDICPEGQSHNLRI